MSEPNRRKAVKQALAEELLAQTIDEWAQTEDIGGSVSEAHRREMAAMLAEPRVWARRRRRLFSVPMLKNCLAGLALLLLVAVGTDALLETADAGFFSRLTRGDMQIESYETHDLISFSAPQTDAVLPEITITPPAGYQLYSEQTQGGRWRRLEYRPEGEPAGAEGFDAAFCVTFAVAEQGYQAYIETGGAERTTCKLAGGEASFYQTAGGNYLLWQDEERRLFCMLDGAFSAEELLALAETIVIED